MYERLEERRDVEERISINYVAETIGKQFSIQRNRRGLAFLCLDD